MEGVTGVEGLFREDRSRWGEKDARSPGADEVAGGQVGGAGPIGAVGREADRDVEGRYKPQAVLGLEIPKPNGGRRQLGISAVIDRLIQQAILQAVQPTIDPTFSEHSVHGCPVSRRSATKTRRVLTHSMPPRARTRCVNRATHGHPAAAVRTCELTSTAVR